MAKFKGTDALNFLFIILTESNQFYQLNDLA